MRIKFQRMKNLAICFIRAANTLFGASVDEIIGTAQAEKSKGDQVGALKGHKKAFKISHAHTCRRREASLRYGIGAAQDYAKTVKFYEKARKLGSADDRSNLADGYVRIRDVERLEQNRSSCFVKAVKWEAAAVGYEPARLAIAAKALKIKRASG